MNGRAMAGVLVGLAAALGTGAAQAAVPAEVAATLEDHAAAALRGARPGRSSARAAREACLAGDVHGGLSLYREALDVSGEPTYLRDMGWCARRNDDPVRARALYRLYLERAPGAPDRDAVLGRIVEAEARIADVWARKDAAAAAKGEERRSESRPTPRRGKLAARLIVGLALAVLGVASLAARLH